MSTQYPIRNGVYKNNTNKQKNIVIIISFWGGDINRSHVCFTISKKLIHTIFNFSFFPLLSFAHTNIHLPHLHSHIRTNSAANNAIAHWQYTQNLDKQKFFIFNWNNTRKEKKKRKRWKLQFMDLDE